MPRISSIVFLLLAAVPCGAAELVSPFAGSEALGEYRTEFARFHYLPSAEQGVQSVGIEGRLTSRLYIKPEAKSNYEIFRSYEKELVAAGFEMLAVMDGGKTELLVRDVNGKDKNDFTHRPYALDGRPVSTIDRALVATQAQHYIAARKTVDRADILVVVSTSRSGKYAIEQLESAAMEVGTVVLSLDALRNQIATEGRIAIYGIHFDTGSAIVKPDSAETLATIVKYLGENPGQSFFVVGHTDAEGSFSSNLTLSEARAEATVQAIVAQLPAARNKLIPHGVGPLSPVATNEDSEGRQLNRRVELVSTLE